jgi:hypothetical protein
MGFISTGATDNMVVYFTPTGINYLMGGKKNVSDLSIAYFSLGDSDINYNVMNKTQKGFIPDLNGEDATCLKAVTLNVNIKYNIEY